MTAKITELVDRIAALEKQHPSGALSHKFLLFQRIGQGRRQWPQLLAEVHRKLLAEVHRKLLAEVHRKTRRITGTEVQLPGVWISLVT